MTRKKITSRNQNPDSPQERFPPPPGPNGLPYVGSMLDWKGPQTNLKWTKEYGSIYKVKMGSKTLVYLNSVEMIEKHLMGRNGENYLDRPMGPAAIAQGLLFGSGNSWEKNKRAFSAALHTKTFSDHMEEAVQSEIQMTLEALQANVDKPVKLGDFLLPACTGVIPGLLLGKTLPKGSHDREVLMRVGRNLEIVDLNSVFTTISVTRLGQPLSKVTRKIVDIPGTSRMLQNIIRAWIRDATTFPLSPTSPRFEAPFHQQDASQTESTAVAATGVCPFEQHSKRLKIVQDDVNTPPSDTQSQEQQRPTLTRGDNSKDLVEFGFTDIGPGEQEFEEAEPPSDPSTPFTPLTEQQWTFTRQMSLNIQNDSILQRILKQPEFANITEGTDLELLQSLIDMFFGGVTSTLAALEFVFVHLVRNPDFQRLAHQEIDEAVSEKDGMITWSMRKDMPYVHACITEALRLGAVTPSSLPHIATKDTEIEGYSIPKGTFIMASIYSMHYDPSHYLDPDVFRPQRHLNTERKFNPPRSFMPYGVGARRCLGETMAEMQLFIYTVHILRHFELQPINCKSLPSLDTHMRIINRLIDFQCVLRKRSS